MTYKNIVIAALGLFVSISAAAAEPNREESIVVTASRDPAPVVTLGSAVTVITSEMIKQRQAVFVTDLLRDVPGFAVSRSGAVGSRTQVRVRGSEANQVLVMIDGVKANDPASGDEFLFENLTTDQIERIEIIRGPQSALWGSDAIGGVIHIITRRSREPLNASVSTEAGYFGTKRVSGSAGTAKDNYALDVGVGYVDTGGTNIARTGAEDDGYANTTVNATGRWQALSNLDFNFATRYTDADSDFDAVDFLGTGLPFDSDRETHYELTTARVGADLALFDRVWTHKVNVTYLDTSTDNDVDGTEASSTGSERTSVYYQTTLRPVELPGSSFTFAVDYEDTDFEQRGMATPFADPNQDQTLDNTGVVFEILAQLTDNASVTTAIRHDWNSDFEDVTTYRVTGAYRVPEANARLRVGFSSGQKAPTLVERFGFFPDLFIGNPDLKPEKSTGWDVGYEQSFFAERLDVSAGYFKEELQDEINGFVFDPATFLFTARNVAGESHRQGFELGFTGTPKTNITLSGNYTYLDATEPDAAGRQIDEIRRPRHNAALNGNLSVLDRLNINVNISYTGEQFDTFFPPFPTPPMRVTLDAYVLGDVALRYALTPNIDLTFRAENVFDEDYEDVFGFATPGFAAYGGIRLSL